MHGFASRIWLGVLLRRLVASTLTWFMNNPHWCLVVARASAPFVGLSILDDFVGRRSRAIKLPLGSFLFVPSRWFLALSLSSSAASLLLEGIDLTQQGDDLVVFS